tara:strand:- start:785 stop:1036 length:252 start_codon:yes stop_codon:yes gene_type:complete
MNKRKYILTKDNYGYKVEVWDDYGKYTCVYEKTIETASRFVYNWWEKSEENKKNDELMSRAVLQMIEIDKKNNIYSNNRDGLD